MQYLIVAAILGLAFYLYKKDQGKENAMQPLPGEGSSSSSSAASKVASQTQTTTTTKALPDFSAGVAKTTGGGQVNPNSASNPNTIQAKTKSDRPLNYTVVNDQAVRISGQAATMGVPSGWMPDTEGFLRSGNMLKTSTGTWYYESWTPIDPAKYTQYLQTYMGKNPATGNLWTYDDLAKVLGVTKQNVKDMDNLRQVGVKIAERA